MILQSAPFNPQLRFYPPPQLTATRATINTKHLTPPSVLPNIDALQSQFSEKALSRRSRDTRSHSSKANPKLLLLVYLTASFPSFLNGWLSSLADETPSAVIHSLLRERQTSTPPIQFSLNINILLGYPKSNKCGELCHPISLQKMGKHRCRSPRF